MYLELEQESIVIGRKPLGFTQHYYTEWDDGMGKEKISLFLLTNIASTQVPGDEIGREAFQLLQDHFLHDLENDAYDRFESALREINYMIREKEKELDLRFIPNMHVLIGVIQGETLFLSQRGEAAGYLVRKRHTSSITDDLFDPKNKDDCFQNIASGELEVDDTLVLTTGNLVQYLTAHEFSRMFSEQSVRDASHEVREMLHGDLDAQMAVLSFEVLEKSQEEVTAAPVVEHVGKIQKERKKLEMDVGLSRLRSWVKTRDRSFPALDKFRELDRKKQGVLLGGSGLILVAAFGTFYLLQSRQGAVDELNGKLAVAEENVTQAATQGTFDKSAAAQLLNEAEQLAKEVLESGHMGGRASELIDDIAEQRLILDNVVMLTSEEVPELADLSALLQPGESIVGVQPLDDKVVVYTQTNAYELLLGEASSPYELDSSVRASEAVYFADREEIVLLTESGDVLEYQGGNTQFADTADTEWQNGVDIDDYSSRVYILDPEDNQIWRYGRGNSSFGSAQASFEDADLSKAMSMAIDGNIWLANSDGTIDKYFAGEKVNFVINKSPLTLPQSPIEIVTDLEMSQLYVLDGATNRVYVYDKSTVNDNLTYSSQFGFADLKGDVVDMYVDIDRGNGAGVVVIATDEAVYEWVR